MARNFYDILGVSRSASEKEIKAAYRRLARQYHPDVNPGDKAAEARFKEINTAHEVLADAEKRRRYDKYGDKWEMADQIEEMEKRQSAGSWMRNGPGGGTYTFEGDSGSFGDFGSIFDTIFRRERAGPRGRPATRRGQDVETPVEVSLEEAYRGTARTISVATVETCTICQGTGEVAGTVCVTCEGSGQAPRQKRLEVRVPPGVKTGSRVRVAGEGRPGVGGGSPGDLYLVVTVQAHPRFERNGDNLTTEIPVNYLDAILGGEVEVQTLDGRLLLKVPPLTQNGRQIKLTGKGMPTLGTSAHGDLFVRIRVQLPEKLSDEERALFEQLRELQARTADVR